MRHQVAHWNASLPERLDTIYLGGGTPSLLSPALLAQLFATIRDVFLVETGAELTVECAPGQVSDEALAAMVGFGVNRISFGVQSFVNHEAKRTGRLHTREVALRDVDRARGAGIARVNVDLIAGLPGQTFASWRESLNVLCGAAPDHASIYMLEVDEDSRLGREINAGGLRYYAPQIPPEDAIAEMYAEAIEFLAANAMPQYEISNFASPGSQSTHNLKYWERQPYLGLGLDAHSMLRDWEGRALRFATTDKLDLFLHSPGWARPDPSTPQEELEEAWFLGLRLNKGVSLSALNVEFGASALDPFQPAIAELESDGLLACSGDHITLTSAGRLLSNEVFAHFLAEPVTA